VASGLEQLLVYSVRAELAEALLGKEPFGKLSANGSRVMCFELVAAEAHRVGDGESDRSRSRLIHRLLLLEYCNENFV
jgi:hypothetical protein